jgi:hypothetical protein
MLTNMHNSSAQGNFCTGLGDSVKSSIVEGYSCFVDKPEWRTGVPLPDTCGNGKIGFYFLSPELNHSEHLYPPFGLKGGKITRRGFHLSLFRNLLAYADKEPCIKRQSGRPANATFKIARSDSVSKQHWPVTSPHQRCRVSSTRDSRNTVRVKRVCVYVCGPKLFP